ncbi:MAG TPA: glycosyltransferase family 9 protein [Methylomirabilota bacterium]|nr:glycosyltransferase family 9 protein [Methylomirabilota bacterium]
MSVTVAGAALAIHPGALGDVLLAIPALRALRAAGARVVLAAQPRLARLLLALGEIDDARDIDALGLAALFAGEGAARLPAVGRVVSWFGARDPEFARRLARLAADVIVASSVAPDRDVWRHLLATVGGDADVRPSGVPDAIVQEGRAALKAAGWDGARRVLVVQPGAGSPAKRWPPEAFAAALAGADAQIVLHRGPADADAVAALSARVPDALTLDEPPLTALAGALARCAAYVGNDSGVSHVAATVGAPSVILYAAPNLAWRPWSPAPRVLTVAMARAHSADVDAVRRALRGLLG